MKRAFIIHKWEGTPASDWYPWLKGELGRRGIETIVPEMPDTMVPRIKSWISALAKAIGEPDTETYLIGHSIGSQTILRYLEGLSPGEQVGGAVFVAGFVKTREGSLTQSDAAIIRPWEETPIDFGKVRRHCGKFTTILSDDDPFVGVENGKIFEKELNSKVIVIPKAGHFGEKDGYRELHVALNEILKIM